jgi:hypothetical protein
MTGTKTLTKADLMQFTGSEHWYRHAMVRDVLYTDGVKHVAETAGAYWLIDEFAFAQRFDELLAAEEFQLWKLNVNPDHHTATLTCEDGTPARNNANAAVRPPEAARRAYPTPSVPVLDTTRMQARTIPPLFSMPAVCGR